MSRDLVLVTGAGGFIGGHLVGALLKDGYRVRAVDLKPLSDWWQKHPDVENVSADLKDLANCRRAVEGANRVYNLAADMGGMGFIEHNKALCMISVLINTHMLMAAKDAKVGRFFYSSSACVYAADKQTSADVKPLARLLGLPFLPVTPTFPWLGPLGLVPYPVRYRIVYGEPLRYYERFGPEGAEDARLVRYLANQVRRAVQVLIDRSRS